MKLSKTAVETPMGGVTLVFNDDGLCALDFEDRWTVTQARLQKRYQDVEFVQSDRGRDELLQYLDGDLCAFDSLPVDPGGTPFQRKVWAQLRQIPPGQTRTYGELAARIGQPTASRAVGLANGRNPISIAIPCHRVIGASGKLVGYAGGVQRKRWLLSHEGAIESSGP